MQLQSVHSEATVEARSVEEALEKVIRDAKGPAGDVVSKAGEAFRAFAGQDWNATIAALLQPQDLLFLLAGPSYG